MPVIQSVDRAARIMKALSAGSRGLGVSELAVSLGLAKTTVHGLLRTLQEHGLVEQNAESGKYQLGPALLELSSGYLDLSELRARSFAWAELLALRTGEAVRVGVLHDNAILGRARIAAPNSDRRDLVTGAAGPREQLVAPEPGERIVSFVIEVARSVSRDLAGDALAAALGAARFLGGRFVLLAARPARRSVLTRWGTGRYRLF